MLEYQLVTTMNQRMYGAFGRGMIESMQEHLPRNASLVVYWEGRQNELPASFDDRKVSFRPFETNEFGKFCRVARILQRDRVTASPSDREYDQKQMFKYDAVRFAHKVYALFDAVQLGGPRYLIWIDADTRATKFIEPRFFGTLLRDGDYMAYLARKKWHSECGFLMFDTAHEMHEHFWSAVSGMYRGLLLFCEDEWHDSFVFDAVRKKFEAAFSLGTTKIAEIEFGHVWNQSALKIVAGLEHFKGPLAGK